MYNIVICIQTYVGIYDAAGAHTVVILWPGLVHPVIILVSAVEMPQSRSVCLGARIAGRL
jgi:hypothetical protein